MTLTPSVTNERRDLAARLDCILDEELQELAQVKSSTLEAWRKRGTGPPYVRLGNAFLYPRAATAAFLASRLNERTTPRRDLL
jgi:hypothetical protein